MTDDQPQKDIFLLLDEVPCNSDNGIDICSSKLAWGKSSGDWRGLNSNGVHLMMALTPLGERDARGVFTGLADYILSKENLDLLFPTHLMQIKLRRMFRCTQSIGRFHEQVVKGIKMCYTNLSPNVNSNSISYIPGHEIYGDIPEILLLPKCACKRHCKNPMEHLFTLHKTKIFALLKRVQKKLGAKRITVLIDLEGRSRCFFPGHDYDCKSQLPCIQSKCISWLKEELEKEISDKGEIIVQGIDESRQEDNNRGVSLIFKTKKWSRWYKLNFETNSTVYCPTVLYTYEDSNSLCSQRLLYNVV